MSLNVLGIQLREVSADMFYFFIFCEIPNRMTGCASCPLVVCGDLKPRLVLWRPSFDF